MANSLTKVEQIAWEHACEAFESMNTFAKNSQIYKPDSGYAELAGQTIRWPYANQIESSTGLDISSDYKDAKDISVPLSISESDIKNSAFKFSATERLVERRVKDNTSAAVRKLSSDINTEVAETIIDKGALVGAETGDLTDYEDFANAGTILDEIEALTTDRFLYLPPRMNRKLANELGMRPTDNSRDHDAYEKSRLPAIDNFETFKTNALKTVSGSSSSGVTVNGASQVTTPVAYSSDGGYTGTESDDIRTQTLTVSASHGMVAGDVFTIAGVNRVGIDSKQDTGQLMTFRVISVATNDLTISPAIVSTGAYQNVSAAPANSAAITLINTADAQPAVFTTRDAVTQFCSDLDFSALEGSASMVLDTYTTGSGISIAFVRQGAIDDLSAKYRFTTWCKPNVVDPLKCGILLPNQGAAI